MKLLTFIASLVIIPSYAEMHDESYMANLISPGVYFVTNEVLGEPSVLDIQESAKSVTSETQPTITVPTTNKNNSDKSHPVIQKLQAPFRMCWRGIKKTTHACSESAIKIGKKAEPYMPFMSLCSALGNIATPFTAHFTNK